VQFILPLLLLMFISPYIKCSLDLIIIFQNVPLSTETESPFSLLGLTGITSPDK